jgi:hypothetical protein
MDRRPSDDPRSDIRHAFSLRRQGPLVFEKQSFTQTHHVIRGAILPLLVSIYMPAVELVKKDRVEGGGVS